MDNYQKSQLKLLFFCQGVHNAPNPWICMQDGILSTGLLGPSKLIQDFGIPGGKIGILGFHSVWNWDFRNQVWNWDLAPGKWDLTLLKLGFWDFAQFEIGILGFLPFSNWDFGIPGPPSLTGPYFYVLVVNNWKRMFIRRLHSSQSPLVIIWGDPSSPAVASSASCRYTFWCLCWNRFLVWLKEKFSLNEKGNKKGPLPAGA